MTMTEGFDGSEVHIRERPIPGTRQVQETEIRCRPGTFEWRYGRAKPSTEMDMLYQAGVEFRRVWERAGMDGPGTVDWGKVGSTQWKGLPDTRCAALDEVKQITQTLGALTTARLVKYVVEEHTSRRIAVMFGQTERDMASWLASDLTAAAVFFHYRPH